MKGRPQVTTSLEITRDLLAKGFYQHPVPPDPLAEIMKAILWGGKYDDEVDELIGTSTPLLTNY